MQQHDTPRQKPMSPQKQLESYYTQPELWVRAHYEGRGEQRMRARVIAALVDPTVNSIIDVGCGNGFVTEHLRARHMVVGIDPSEPALRGFRGIKAVANGGNLPFPDRCFDAGICTEVLEHLSRDAQARTISELDRVIIRDLLVGVPYRQDLRTGMAECVDCGLRYHVDLHQHSFRSPSDVSRLFRGFRTEAVVLLCERDEIRSRVFRHLRCLLLRPDASSSCAKCPRCGSGKTFSYASGPRRFLPWLLNGLAWRMPKKRVPHWMVVLLRRKEFATGS